MTERLSEPERLALNEAQTAALERLCQRYGVDFDPADYYVHPAGSFLTPQWAEGWIGGRNDEKRTIYVGVSPEGQIHS